MKIMEDSGIDSGDKVKNDNTESDDSSNNNVEVIFKGTTNVHIDTDPKYSPSTENVPKQRSFGSSTCRTLQRKLEMKVERAKRNYNQMLDVNDSKNKSSALIPINRLQIPGCQENVPLVEYKTDNSDEDEEISFYPTHKLKKNQELSDTFSLQEMTIISEDSDDSESQSLQFALPKALNQNVLESLTNYLCCRIFKMN